MSPADYIKPTDSGAEIKVAVLPRSSDCRIVGIQDGALKIKLTQPPVDGRANAECSRFLAKQLGVPRSRVTVVQGSASRRKIVKVEGGHPPNISGSVWKHCLKPDKQMACNLLKRKQNSFQEAPYAERRLSNRTQTAIL